jgi:copper chaperone CopZ
MRPIFTCKRLTLNLLVMKKEKVIQVCVILTIMVAVIACGRNNNKAEKSPDNQQPAIVEVSIGGMSCTGCEQTIQTNLSKLEGVMMVKASFATGTAIVEYLPALVDTVKMREAIAGSGYTCKKFSETQPEETSN